MQTGMQTGSAQHGSSREVHLRDYAKILWQGRYTILTVFLLVTSLAFLRATLAKPIYEASTVIEVKPEARRIIPGQEQWVGAEGSGWLAEEKYFNTQLEVLKSRDVAQRTFRQLHLEDHPLFRASSDPVSNFQGRISIRPKVNTRLVTVSVQGPNPKEVREWVNTLAEVYVRRNVDEATASFRAIMDQIESGLATMQTNLENADIKTLQSGADEDLFVPENSQEILRQSLEKYNANLSDLRVEIGSLNAEIENLDRVRLAGGDLMTLPRFNQDPQVQELLNQKLSLEKEMERMVGEKRPRHPDYTSKRAELEQLDQKIRDQNVRNAEKLRVQQRLALQNAAYLQEQIRRTEQDAYHVKQASSNYERQKNEADTKRKVYDVVAETMERLAVGAQLISMNNNVAVLDKATEPRRPVRPRKKLAIGFGAVLGLLLGVGTVLMVDYFDNTVRSPEDIEQFLGLAILAVVPKYKETDSNAAREAFQSLRTSVLFSSHNREKRVLLLTSAGPQEGKSSMVVSLARAMASAGDRVIVVDCDLRRPTQHSHLGVPREPGLTNYLLDSAEGDYERYVTATDHPKLRVFTCGPIPPNPPELIGLAKFSALLADLKRSYDWVIVDSPPVASLADSVVLASMADMMALVIKHNENDRDLIRRSLKRLRDVNVHVIGAILNSVDLGRGQKDYYYANYHYTSTDDGAESKKGTRRSSGRPADKDNKIAL